MIERIWHGWTSHEDADEYEELLLTEIFPDIDAKTSDGLQGYRVGRREHDDEVEFVTSMRFDSWAAVRSFVGEDYQQAHIPDSAAALLSRYDEQAQHFEIRAEEAV
jgi:hypothetical protein